MIKRGAIAAGAVVLILAFPGMAPASEVESVHISLSTAYATRYMWRGITLNQDPVYQPSVTFAQSGFTLNFWGNVETTDWGKEYGGYGDKTGQLTEADYTALYSRTVVEKVNFAVGFVTYTYPHTGLHSTTEIYFLLGFDVPLHPTLSYYVDEDGWPGAAYYGLELSHGFKLWESGERGVELDLSGHLAYANSKFIWPYYYINVDNGAWHDWSAGVALPCAVGYGITITPAYLHTALWDTRLRDHVAEYGDEIKTDNDVFTLSVAWDLTL